MTRSFAVLAALTISAAPASAQTPLWLASCSNQADATVLGCEIAQSIVLTEGNQRVATVALTKLAGQPEVNALFTLPVGLFLPAGLTIAVDETPLGTLDFTSCDGQGCYATGAVSDEWLERMQSGETLVLTIERPDRQEVALSFPLDGFGTAFELLP